MVIGQSPANNADGGEAAVFFLEGLFPGGSFLNSLFLNSHLSSPVLRRRSCVDDPASTILRRRSCVNSQSPFIDESRWRKNREGVGAGGQTAQAPKQFPNSYFGIDLCAKNAIAIAA
jgi:hypothetical protein